MDPTPKLVVVDDEEGLLFLMTDALRREGYDVTGFDTAAEALRWLIRESPDLLLLDLKLGDLSAPKLLQRLAEQGRKFPFIIVTGHGDERTAVELMKDGALDYVMKDAGMLELLPGIVQRAFRVIDRDRKIAEGADALRRREERHLKIIHTARDGFVRFDRTGHILEVNSALCELLGYSADQLLSKNVLDGTAARFNEELRERVSQLQDQAFARCFSRLRRADNSAVDVEISLRADSGEVFCFVRDLSEQRRLEREVLRMSEDERHRVGRELHDGLGQQLTVLELMSHTLARELKSAHSSLAKSADQISKCARQAISQARRLAHGLAPFALEGHGLMAALHALAAEVSTTGVDCHFEGDQPAHVDDPTVATHLFRIAQEAANNALKHAKARHIIIRFHEAKEALELSIEDDGRGFRGSPSRKSGVGLHIMQYRAHLIGGLFRAESRPGKGVRITCSLPKP